MADAAVLGAARPPPARFERPSALGFLAWVIALALIVTSLDGVGFSPRELVSGLPNMGRIIGEMFPPSPARLMPVALALLETFQMALAGTVLGVLLSLPLAVLATRHLTPHPLVYHAVRGVIALFRTVPDLVWALFFVAAVGLGPFAGALAITIDKIGFCGRFFAEAMEEADRGPQEALGAMGASRASIVAAAVIPAALPSFVNTTLFALEKATRSSVILGLVGAGGIGIELQVSMDLFRYAEASTIIIAIFLLVVVVEQASAWLRRRLIQ
ncbi:MAG: phosphonate ABC transporter, permease protein PhnE [Alphaproteobacteria bacterium]|nr:phosphonate ABC transporter, permease protein PhnE [Alphaproteobacteria bacterium]